MIFFVVFTMILDIFHINILLKQRIKTCIFMTNNRKSSVISRTVQLFVATIDFY